MARHRPLDAYPRQLHDLLLQATTAQVKVTCDSYEDARRLHWKLKELKRAIARERPSPLIASVRFRVLRNVLYARIPVIGSHRIEVTPL